MSRAVVAALAWACLLAAPTASADWSQQGYTSTGFNHVPGDGPSWDDVAFERSFADIGFPGAGTPIVHAGTAYVVVQTQLSTATLPNPPNPLASLFAMNLTTGAVERHDLGSLVGCCTEFGGAYGGFKLAWTDGRILVLGNHVLAAMTPDGRAAWPPVSLHRPAAAATSSAAGQTYDLCVGPVVSAGKAFAACGGSRQADANAGASSPFEVYAVDISAGTLAGGSPWVYEPDPRPATPPATGVVGTGFSTPFARLAGIASDGSNVAITWADLEPSTAFGAVPLPDVPVYGRVSGQTVWVLNGTNGKTVFQTSNPFPVGGGIDLIGSPPAISGDQVYWRWNLFNLHALSGGPTVSSSAIREPDDPPSDLGSGFAIGDGAYVVSTRSNLVRLDAQLQTTWTLRLGPGEQWDGPALLAHDAVYARSVTTNGHQVVYAVNATTGQQVWRHIFPRPQHVNMALSDGVLACQAEDGTITLLGSTAFALQPIVSVSSLFPADGEQVDADVSASHAIGFTPPTQFSADWGDGGGPGPGQDAPQFKHHYTSKTDEAARFFVRNTDNQTASMPVIFHVGQEDTSLSWFQRAFLPQHQNETYFVLGLTGTALAAAAGVLLRGRKRRRMHRELQNLESVFRHKRDQPDECEPELQQRKQHFRDLLSHRKLEGDQFGILTDRADDLLGRIRMGTVEEDFSFLPLGVARTLQRMLRDGRVTAAERSFVLGAVRQDKVLSASQKAKVVAQVEHWFQSDAKA